MKAIRVGSTGKLVKKWQMFLRGLDFYQSVVDGKFGPKTEQATIAYQIKNKLGADGIVGNQTWGFAMANGLDMVTSDSNSKFGPNWPQPTLSPIRLSQRRKIFGAFTYKPAPTASNPEAIWIDPKWSSANITMVTLPQLKGVKYAPRTQRVSFNRKVSVQLVELFNAWEKDGLADHILTWGGSWAPRFIRGSRTTLSNHALGTAFDINVPWNGLGRRPALVNEKGSVRELVKRAEEFGFFWGGFFGSRPDGMHFEAAKVL